MVDKRAMKRVASARKVIGRKTVNGKTYTYEYYTLPLNMYLPKEMVRRWGTDFIVERDERNGRITIISKKALNSNKGSGNDSLHKNE